MSVLVGIPTHRRPELLRQCLDSIAAQAGDLPPVRVFVADNDFKGREGVGVVDQIADAYRFPIAGTVVPEPGISAVRNAILDEARRGGDAFIAMIDDDETASPEWLAELLKVQAEYGADIVGGPSIRESPAEAPMWLHNPEAFGTVQKPTGLVESANSTSNVLLSCPALDRLGWQKFDMSYGLSGGSDKEYFLRLGSSGASFAWANDSKVHEPIPLSRCTLKYVLRRSFRNGGINRRLHRKYGYAAAPDQLWALKSLFASPLLVILAIHPRFRLKALRRIAHAAGMLGEDLGISYFEYAERHERHERQV